jgi:hypothetical protein
LNAIFTIVAKNYIGLAQVLEESVRKNSTADFYIIVADEIDNEISSLFSFPNNVLIAKTILSSIDDTKWKEISFKYNLVEFCTSIKPACFDYLINKQLYKIIIYKENDE